MRYGFPREATVGGPQRHLAMAPKVNHRYVSDGPITQKIPEVRDAQTTHALDGWFAERTNIHSPWNPSTA